MHETNHDTKHLSPHFPILVVDDEHNILNVFKLLLEYSGLTNVMTCRDSREVVPILEKQPVELILLDLIMPNISGEQLLRTLNERFPQVPVIIITAVNKLDTAVECMKHGAVDYMVKPVEQSRLISGVKRIIELQALKRENLTLKNRILSDRLEQPDLFADIVTRNDKMISIFKYMEAIAASDEPVLITGETGVGKELFANALHRLSNRKGHFVSVNVAGLDDNMFSDTLFGHKRGAFTDAHQVRKGLVEQAVNGTLFLDEIGELNMVSQVKLLRLLQEKEYYPLGSDVPRYAQVRALFSTNRDLGQLVKSGEFRNDLYYRIHTHHIHIPPLRERIDDLPLLADHFLEEAAQLMNKTKPPTAPDLYRLLEHHGFPGNVRELRALIIDAASSVPTGQELTPHYFPFPGTVVTADPVVNPAPPSPGPPEEEQPDFDSLPHLPTLKNVETNLIDAALKRSGGNISQAAKMLGLTRQTLSKKLKNKKIKSEKNKK